MGLRDWFGSLFEKRWECTTCGEQYRSDPRTCGNCGGTVFRRCDR